MVLSWEWLFLELACHARNKNLICRQEKTEDVPMEVRRYGPGKKVQKHLSFRRKGSEGRSKAFFGIKGIFINHGWLTVLTPPVTVGLKVRHRSKRGGREQDTPPLT